MYDVPSIVAFCSESIERIRGMISKFFFKLIFIFPVDSIITGIGIHHMLCSSFVVPLHITFGILVSSLLPFA
jgi:hypothetical protein